MLKFTQSDVAMLAKTAQIQCTFQPCEFRGSPGWELVVQTDKGAEGRMVTAKGETKAWRQLNNAIADLLNFAPELEGAVLTIVAPAKRVSSNLSLTR